MLCIIAKTAEEAGDSDALYKQKMKDQTDVGSKDIPIGRGDSVLLRRETRSKLDTMYHPEPYKVVDVQGTDMTCAGPVGNVVRRHVSVARKIVEPDPSPIVSDPLISSCPIPVAPDAPSSVSGSPGLSSSSPGLSSSSPGLSSSSPGLSSSSPGLSSSSPGPSVRVRERRMPVRFQDYHVY